MENLEEILKAFIVYLVLDAAKQGILLQSEQDLLAYTQKLGKDGLKAKYKEFMSKMQGGTMARLGAKLEYYKKLKGTCPEGELLVYFKKGGQLCKVCEKALKGEKIDQNKNEVEKFKLLQQLKKQQKRLDPNTTKKLPGGKYPSYWTSQERLTWERKYGQYDDGAASTTNKGIGKNKQGGLLIPKHEKGNPIKKYRVSFLGENSKFNREFDTMAEAKKYRESKGLPAKFVDLSSAWLGDVLRADRSNDRATAYARQEAEAPYNKLSFANAHKLAKQNGDRWFAYKGKVYDSGLKKGEYKRDNLNYMKLLYGNYLGWKGDSKLHTNASKKGREKQNSELNAKAARPYDPKVDGPITNTGHMYGISINGVPIGHAYDLTVKLRPKVVLATEQLLHPVFRLEDEPVVVEARKQGGLLRKKL